MDALIDQIIAPIGRRIGTVVGTALGGYGLADGDVSAVAAGAVALFGIAVDLALLYVKTRRSK